MNEEQKAAVAQALEKGAESGFRIGWESACDYIADSLEASQKTLGNPVVDLTPIIEAIRTHVRVPPAMAVVAVPDVLQPPVPVPGTRPPREG